MKDRKAIINLKRILLIFTKEWHVMITAKLRLTHARQISVTHVYLKQYFNAYLKQYLKAFYLIQKQMCKIKLNRNK